MFTEEYIQNLYVSKVKLPDTYFKICPVKAYTYNWSYYDFPRNWKMG